MWKCHEPINTYILIYLYPYPYRNSTCLHWCVKGSVHNQQEKDFPGDEVYMTIAKYLISCSRKLLDQQDAQVCLCSSLFTNSIHERVTNSHIHTYIQALRPARCAGMFVYVSFHELYTWICNELIHTYIYPNPTTSTMHSMFVRFLFGHFFEPRIWLCHELINTYISTPPQTCRLARYAGVLQCVAGWSGVLQCGAVCP